MFLFPSAPSLVPSAVFAVLTVNSPGKGIRPKSDAIERESFLQPHQFLGLGHHACTIIALPERWKKRSGKEKVGEPHAMVLQLKKPT